MFNLEAYLESKRTEVEDALDRSLPAADCSPHILHEAMRYCVFSGGKRLRPVLCLAAAEAVADPRPQAAIHPAVAVELLHTYTLIHDDLPCMDDDDERRGMPTCHIKFGEANAILAGDALQALAFSILTHVDSDTQTARLVMELSLAAGSRGVVGGQVADIENTGQPLDAATLDFIHQHKTADLFRAAIRMGAIVADAETAALDALSRYAGALGMAFQMVDDILDARSAGGASAGGESSCVTVYGVDEACRRVKQLTDTAVAALGEIHADGPLAALARHMAERTY